MMLIKYKERYRILFRAIALAVFCLLIFNDIAFALSPKLRLTQAQFEEEYLLRSAILASDITHNYISAHVNLNLRRTDGGIEIKGVKGLLKNIGQIAKVDVDSVSKAPVIHVDTNYFYNETVVGFEKEKVRALMKLWQLKKDKYQDMTAWIVDHMDRSDPDVGGMTSRQKADEIHRIAHQKYPGIGRLYDRIKTKYKKAKDRGQSARAESLLNFASMYAFYKQAGYILDRDDKKNINFAAHEKDSKDKNIGAGKGRTSRRESAVKRLNAIARTLMPRQDGEPTLIEDNTPELAGKTVLSVSMEGHILEFARWPEIQMANMTGGLGIFEGDLAEGLDKIGMAGWFIQPGYMFDPKGNYIDYGQLVDAGVLKEVKFEKDIAVWTWIEEDGILAEMINGNKEISEKQICEVFGDWCKTQTHGNALIKVKFYEVVRKGVKRYIAVSPVFDSLYTGNRYHRLSQEACLGKAVCQFAKQMNIIPDILHLNEGHVFVTAAEMKTDPAFDKTAIIVTDHTPVEAGHEKFEGDINRMTYVLGPGGDYFRDKLVRAIDGKPVVDFSLGVIELADRRNGVSKIHADRTAKIFQEIVKEKTGEDRSINIIPVLNGSGDPWVNDKLLEYQSKGKIPTEDELYEMHEAAKINQALKEVEKRTGRRLDPDMLTVWMVRRITEYKSQYPILRFLVHIMCADRDEVFTEDKLMEIWKRDILSHIESGTEQEKAREREMPYYKTLEKDLRIILRFIFGGRKKIYGRGMQLVVGGPEYEGHWVNEFKRWMDLPALKGRFVYVPDSGVDLIKMQAIGADICVNMARSLDEACGTSGSRSGRNGGIALSEGTMGDIEWITPYDARTKDGSGFLFGPFLKKDQSGQLEADWDKFYQEGPGALLKESGKASDIYYKKDRLGQPDKRDWKRLMLNTYTASTYGVYIDREGRLLKRKAVTSKAMAERYARDMFLPVIRMKSDTKTIVEMVIRDDCDYDENGQVRTSGLRNAKQELEAMAKRGVKYVTLIGLAKHTGSPYEIMNPMSIDERAGNWKELEAFLNTAHKVGIKVLFDWLANQHFAKTSPICDSKPDAFLYTNVSDGDYKVGTDLSCLRKGRDLPIEELKRRIRNGKRIVEIIKGMEKEGKTVPEEGIFDVYGEKIRYWRADMDARKNLASWTAGHTPVVVREEDALFLASATDLVATDRGHARRWDGVAQPDLSHPYVISMAIATGRFWMRKKLDGARIDAALSNFPDRSKDNWGIKLEDNLTVRFLHQMRQINRNCFFLFEGFDRQAELLALADNRDSACYSWQARDYITKALQDKNNLPELIDYLKALEGMPKEIRDNLVNLGPEHDSADFNSPPARLTYRDRNLMYFMFMFIPGFRMVLNGEVFGIEHKYKNEIRESERVPPVSTADKTKMAVREKIFSLPRKYKMTSNDIYAYLNTSSPENAIGLIRYDKDGIVIGAQNFTYNSGWATFDMGKIIERQRQLGADKHVAYQKITYMLNTDGTKWESAQTQHMTSEELMENGLSVNLGPKCCELIQLVKVAAPLDKGSPAQGLKFLYDNKAFSKEDSLTVKELVLMRGYSGTTVRVELKNLVRLGLVIEDKSKEEYRYYLSENLARAPPELAKKAVDSIIKIDIGGVKVMDLWTISEDKFAEVDKQVKTILASLPDQNFWKKRIPSEYQNFDDNGLLILGTVPLGRDSDRDVENGLAALDNFGLMASKLEEDGIYVIRLNKDRFSEVPYGVEIVEEYVKLLKLRAADPENVILKYSNKVGLLSVQSYKNKGEYFNGRMFGEGSIGIGGEIKNKQLNLPALLNMAVAASNIRANLPAGEAYDDYEKALILLIRNQYKQIYGEELTVPDNGILYFIKDLPPIDKPLPVDRIESYYRLVYQKLQQAA